jgi:hypothetical protein
VKIGVRHAILLDRFCLPSGTIKPTRRNLSWEDHGIAGVLHGMIFELPPMGRSSLEVDDGMDAESMGPVPLETNRGRRRLQ